MIITCKHAAVIGGRDDQSGRAVIVPSDERVMRMPCCAHTEPFDPELLAQAKQAGALPRQILNLDTIEHELQGFPDQGLIGALRFGVTLGHTGDRTGKRVHRNLPSSRTEAGAAALVKAMVKDRAGLPAHDHDVDEWKRTVSNGEGVGFIGDHADGDLPHVLVAGKTPQEAIDYLRATFPCLQSEDEWYVVSPLGVVLEEWRKARPIDDYTTRGEGLNMDSLHVTLPQLRMTRTKDFRAKIAAMKKAAPHKTVACFSCDIRSYFRHLRHAVGDYPMLLFYDAATGTYNVRLGAGFGSRNMPSQASRFSGAMRWRLYKDGINHYSQYCDDGASLGYLEDEEDCRQTVTAIESLCARWNIVLAPEKTVPFTSEFDYIGIAYDTVQDRISVTADRAQRALGHLRKARVARLLPEGLLCSIFHVLISLDEVTSGGRVFTHFIRRLWLRSKHTGAAVRTSVDFKYEVQYWIDVIERNDGRPISARLSERPLEEGFASDASGSGAGAWSDDGEYFCWQFDGAERAAIGDLCRRSVADADECQRITIASLEFHVLLCGLATWGERWRGKRVRVWCDNQNVCSWLQTGKVTAASDVAARFLREFYLLCNRFDVQVEVEYIHTLDNTGADQLSRGDLAAFLDSYLMLTGHPATPVTVPPAYRHVLLQMSTSRCPLEACSTPSDP